MTQPVAAPLRIVIVTMDGHFAPAMDAARPTWRATCRR
jgi:hypothetical protein